jgi:diaminopimelate decarboxylase
MVGSQREGESVVGPLCMLLELLTVKITLARAEVDDLIVVFQKDAYGERAVRRSSWGRQRASAVLV